MITRVRIALCMLAAVTAVLGVAAEAAVAGPGSRPNVVLVLTDDQRWDTLRYMPTVRRELVAPGVTFSNAFVVNPLCCPSRASILTGKYSHSTRVYSNDGPYGGFASFSDRSTLATWLQAEGYETAYFGKYLNRYSTTYVPPGWDRWVALTHPPAYYGYTLNVDGNPVPFGDAPSDYSTDVIRNYAVRFIRATRRPLFLVFAPYAPHWPATPAPRHAGAFSDLPPWRPPSYDEADVSDKPRWVQARPRLGSATRASLDELRRKQLASLLAVDDAVGAIVDAFRTRGRLDDTVFVFTSDNGFLWGEHRIVATKLAAYEESIRVPLVVRYDDLVVEPRADGNVVANIDLAPTLAALAGAAAPGVDGRSLVPLLASPFASLTRPLLVEHLTELAPTYCAVRTRNSKYVAYQTQEEELYALDQDRYELVNRASDPAFAARLRAMRLLVKDLCVPPPPGFTTEWIPTSGTSPTR